MDTSADVKRIGVQLQNLLNIPGIKKVDATSSMPVMEAATSNKPPLTDILQKNVIQKNDTAKGNKKIPPVDLKKTGSDEGHHSNHNPVSNKSLLATPPVILRQAELHQSHHQPIAKTQKEGKSFGARRNDIKPLMRSQPQENEMPPSNMSNHNNDGSNTLVQLLQRIDCPEDLRDEKSTLLDYAYRERNGGGGVASQNQIKRILSSHGIEALTKKSSKFPKAKFICSSCNYHMDNLYACVLHIVSSSRHITYEYMKKLEFTLIHIPEPSHEHCLSISRFLSYVFQKYALQDEEVSRRKAYVDQLNQDLQASNLACTLTLFGSSYTSLGFQDADININISTEGTTSTPADNFEILQKLFLFFQHHPTTLEVKKMVSSKSATIHFREKESLCEVTVSMNNTAGVETAKLFYEYVKLSPIVRPLVIGLRRWAKVCEIDNQDRGSLPPTCWTIMVLYFLQQIEVLPNLHHVRSVYCKEVAEGDGKMKDFASAAEASTHWKPCATSRLTGAYWIDMLRFYALEFNYKEHVVSISQLKVYRSDKYWNRKISIEDPVIPKSNLSRSMSNNRMCEYILERFKFTYLYFGVPRTIRGPLYDGIIPTNNVDKCRPHVFHKVVLATNTNTKPLEKLTNPMWDPISLADEVKIVKWNGHIKFPATELESVRVRMHNVAGSNHREKSFVYIEDAKILEIIFPEWLYHYQFDSEFFQNGVKPPVICKSCGIEGHLKSDCPDEILPALKPVMNATPASLRLFHDVLCQNFHAEALNDEDVQIRLAIIKELQECLQPLYPEAQLSMFGSTYNGFGVHLSDIDVCLTFRDSPASKTEGSNGLTILRTIVERLKGAGFMQEVLAIPSAKVPIIKFCHRKYNLEGDISLYNTLAMHNTRLLRTYADIDVRVKIIGCFVKKLTKLCDISDASRGSLSSYGYVLMVIHYFQHLQAPVLPVLQELNRDSRQSIIIDGCDVQYFQDVQELSRVWPMYGRNRQSLSELWLGFLNYYTETFNFDEHVVTIAQLAPLTRISKFWLTDAIAIEDPFERNHNLGAGLSRRMSVHILKTFHHLRQVFHASYESTMLKKHNNWLSFFTDPKLLQNGNPPLDRQCRICHKIGHFARNCTFHEKNGDDQGAGKNDKKQVPPSLVDLVDEKVKEKHQDHSRKIPKTLAEIENLPERNISENEADFRKEIRDPLENDVNECHDGTENVTWRAVTGFQVADQPSGPVRNEEFPQFFDAHSPEDEILRMTKRSSSRQSPGVEFLLKEEEESPKPFMNNVNFGSIFLPYPDLYQNSFIHGPMSNFNCLNPMMMRGGCEPASGMNQVGVSFMGSPFPSSMAPPGFEDHHRQLPPGATFIHPMSGHHPYPVGIYPIPMNGPHAGHFAHMQLSHVPQMYPANMGQMLHAVARPPPPHEHTSTPTSSVVNMNGDSSTQAVMSLSQNPDSSPSPPSVMNVMNRVCLPNVSLQSHMSPFSQLLNPHSNGIMTQFPPPRVNDN